MYVAIQQSIVVVSQNKCTKFHVAIVYAFLSKIRNLYVVLVLLFLLAGKQGGSVCETE